MLMDGDADQPGKTNGLDGVVWHADASDNGSMGSSMFGVWKGDAFDAQVSNLTLFPYPDSKIAKPILFQNCP